MRNWLRAHQFGLFCAFPYLVLGVLILGSLVMSNTVQDIPVEAPVESLTPASESNFSDEPEPFLICPECGFESYLTDCEFCGASKVFW